VLQIALDGTQRRVLRIGMITTAHFMPEIWDTVNAVKPIEPPTADLIDARG
jgi:hypothetical protein